jgi:hypothetical protein
MKFFTPLKTAVLITILSYLILNSIVIFNGNRYKKELSKFDLNQDGFFTENEMSEQQQKAMEKVAHDTSRTFAPFTLIPVAVLLGYITYYVQKKRTKNNI